MRNLCVPQLGHTQFHRLFQPSFMLRFFKNSIATEVGARRRAGGAGGSNRSFQGGSSNLGCRGQHRISTRISNRSRCGQRISSRCLLLKNGWTRRNHGVPLNVHVHQNVHTRMYASPPPTACAHVECCDVSYARTYMDSI